VCSLAALIQNPPNVRVLAFLQCCQHCKPARSLSLYERAALPSRAALLVRGVPVKAAGYVGVAVESSVFRQRESECSRLRRRLKCRIDQAISTDLAADLRNAGGQQRQSRSAFKRACATAAWPDALQ
jgi:hypothetical protein